MAASYRFAEGGHFRQWSFVRLCGQGSFGSVFEAEAEGEPHCAVKVGAVFFFFFFFFLVPRDYLHWRSFFRGEKADCSWSLTTRFYCL